MNAGEDDEADPATAKAADRDYRFFIVLSGIHNGLRQQTQERLYGDL